MWAHHTAATGQFQLAANTQHRLGKYGGGCWAGNGYDGGFGSRSAVSSRTASALRSPRCKTTTAIVVFETCPG